MPNLLCSLDTYRKSAPFADGFQEFDIAKQVVTDLISEYEEAEKASYLDVGSEKGEP